MPRHLALVRMTDEEGKEDWVWFVDKECKFAKAKDQQKARSTRASRSTNQKRRPKYLGTLSSIKAGHGYPQLVTSAFQDSIKGINGLLTTYRLHTTIKDLSVVKIGFKFLLSLYFKTRGQRTLRSDRIGACFISLRSPSLFP